MAEEEKPGTVIHLAFVDPIGDPNDDPDHEPTENEKWYDAEIAPALKTIMEKIVARGMACSLTVEIDPATALIGSTRGIPANHQASARMRLIQMAERCGGNIDKLLIWVYRDMKKLGLTGKNNPSAFMRHPIDNE